MCAGPIIGQEEKGERRGGERGMPRISGPKTDCLPASVFSMKLFSVIIMQCNEYIQMHELNFGLNKYK